MPAEYKGLGRMEDGPVLKNPVLKSYFNEAIERMLKIHASKRLDYSKEANIFSNFEIAAHFADVDVQTTLDTLIGIKQARLNNLREKNPVNESIEDTLLDRAVYATIAYAYALMEKEQMGTPIERVGRYERSEDR
jgi:hypothetical protein